MTTFITGATGFIGSRVVGLIRDDVIALVRQRNEQLERLGVEQVVGDLLEPGTYKSVVDRCDTVIHLAAIIDEKDPEMDRVNVEGTRLLLDSCSGGQRFVYASTAGVFDHGYGTPVTEESPFGPGTPYEHSKLRAETLVKESGLLYTILRPTLVYGPSSYWRGILKLMKKNFPLIGPGTNMFHLVHLDDAARAFVAAAGDAHVNKEYIIASSEALTLKETYETVKRILNVDKPTRHVPEWLAMGLAKLAKLAGSHLFIPEHVKRLTRNRHYDVARANAAGLECPTTMLDGMKKVLQELDL